MGLVDLESGSCFLQDLLPFMDGGPKDHHVTLSHKRPRESSITSLKVKGIEFFIFHLSCLIIHFFHLFSCVIG